jgi:hypothetical protein
VALYQLTLFYPSLAKHAQTVRRIRSEVEAVAGRNWRVLSAGEQVCGIAFETELEKSVLRERLTGFNGIEQFQFLLVEVSEVVQGYMSQDVWQWLRAHQHE